MEAKQAILEDVTEIIKSIQNENIPGNKYGAHKICRCKDTYIQMDKRVNL